MECLQPLICKLLEAYWIEDDDKLFMSVLAEINDRFDRKLLNYQAEYSMKFTAAEAFAMRLLYSNYNSQFDLYARTRLLQIANEVHQHYS